jgi:drug/metabolite transporter (DMT)-like permease
MTHPPAQPAANRGYVEALAASVLLSTTALFIRVLTATHGMPALVLAAWRDGLTVAALAVLLAVVQRRWLRVGRQHLAYLTAYGLVLAVFNALWALSVAANGAAVATVLIYSSAPFTALLGWWLLRERLSWPTLAAIGLSLAGCALVAGALRPEAWAASAHTAGVALGLLAGLAYAGYTLMGRGAAQRGLSPWTTLLYTFAVATGWLVLANTLGAARLPGAGSGAAALLRPVSSPAAWALLAGLAAGPTLLGFGLYNVSLVHLPSSTANLILVTEPVWTALGAYLLLGERLTGEQLVGSALILAGVLVLRLAPAGQSPPKKGEG